jgi:type IV pilus assembly protein PilX
MNQRKATQRNRTRQRQQGAALVIGLILLMILTLLAISGMNTSVTELIMAGNEQYRQNASQASATGVELALTQLQNVPQTSTPTVVGPNTVPGSTTDQYTTSSRYLGETNFVTGFSVGKYVGFHYEITSTGTAVRNARTVTTQGAYIVQRAP